VDQEVHATAGREASATVSCTAGRKRRWGTEKDKRGLMRTLKPHHSRRQLVQSSLVEIGFVFCCKFRLIRRQFVFSKDRA